MSVQPHEALKPLGALAIVLVSAGMAFIVWRWPQQQASISQHAGSQRASYWLFASMLTAVGALFFPFMWLWFGPTFRLGWPYYAFLALGAVLQQLTAWLPDNGSGKGASLAHRLAAFSMAGAMMALVGCVALAPHAAAVSRLLAAAVFAAMGVFWYMFFFVKSSHRYFLRYQASYIASFYVLILVTTYVR